MSTSTRGRDDLAGSRRTGLVVAGLCGVAFVALAWWLIPWDWLPGGTIDPPAPEEVFSERHLARAEDYSAQQRALSWWGLGVSLLVAGLLGLTRWGAALVRRLPGPWWLQVPLGTLAVLLLGELATTPVGWLRHEVDREYGTTEQPFAPWLWDRGLSLLVTWVFTGLAVLVVVGIARRAPRWWPAVAAALTGALVFLGSFVYPLVVEPVFNDFSSMEQGPLKEQILDLAEAEGVHVDDVLVADASRRTTRLNAYVSGFGSTKRVVVYDTLVDALPEDQALSVVAHEIAHTKHRDVLVGTALSALGAGFGIGLLGWLLSSRWLLRRADAGGAADPAVVPLLLLLVTLGTLLSSPVENTMSRAVEARADRSALLATRDPDAFEEMQLQLSRRSVADPTPPAWRQWWWGSHPTALQRIGMARAMAPDLR